MPFLEWPTQPASIISSVPVEMEYVFCTRISKFNSIHTSEMCAYCLNFITGG